MASLKVRLAETRQLLFILSYASCPRRTHNSGLVRRSIDDGPPSAAAAAAAAAARVRLKIEVRIRLTYPLCCKRQVFLWAFKGTISRCGDAVQGCATHSLACMHIVEHIQHGMVNMVDTLWKIILQKAKNACTYACTLLSCVAPYPPWHTGHGQHGGHAVEGRAGHAEPHAAARQRGGPRVGAAQGFLPVHLCSRWVVLGVDFCNLFLEHACTLITQHTACPCACWLVLILRMRTYRLPPCMLAHLCRRAGLQAAQGPVPGQPV